MSATGSAECESSGGRAEMVDEFHDRGWAWAIVAGITVINMAILPMQQCFGLIFEERFQRLGITATQTSLILHLNISVMCALGLINGPMMRRLSFRKVACLGGAMIVIGMCLTAFARSLPAIIVTYCVLIGIGQGIIHPATSLALNTYFREKRNIAMGISVTLTGLGPIVMSQLIARLLEDYGTTGTVLILAGIATHAFVGAALLRPFRGRKISDVVEDGARQRRDVEMKEFGATNGRGEISESSRLEATEGGAAKGNCVADVDVEIASETRSGKIEAGDTAAGEGTAFVGKSNATEDRRRKGHFFADLATSLDLDLFCDSRYVVIVLGMSVSFVSELNFNLMIPFVLSELANLERSRIATVMSIQAAADITGRLCVPLLAQQVGWSSRNLYAASLLGSTIARTLLSALSHSYGAVIAVSLLIGVAKGTKAVFQSLIVPDNVPLERLPAASGLLMVCNGILSLALGPLIGLVHDATDSYTSALNFTSILSLLCIVLWIGETVCTPRAKRITLREEVEGIVEDGAARRGKRRS